MDSNGIKSFLKNFLACYGMLWFIPMAASFMSQTHINTGEFGYYGFPLISLIYAFIMYFRQKLRQDSEPSIPTTLRNIDLDVSKTLTLVRELHKKMDSSTNDAVEKEAL